MPLQIDRLPLKGLVLSGTLAASDVDRLVQAIRDEDGAIGLDFRSGVMSVRADAAAGLFQSVNELWESGERQRKLSLHAVAGAVADALQRAGLKPAGEETGGRSVLLPG